MRSRAKADTVARSLTNKNERTGTRIKHRPGAYLPNYFKQSTNCTLLSFCISQARTQREMLQADGKILPAVIARCSTIFKLSASPQQRLSVCLTSPVSHRFCGNASHQRRNSKLEWSCNGCISTFASSLLFWIAFATRKGSLTFAEPIK